jgi:hypothetical protein
MGVGTRPSGAAGRRGTAARGGRPGSGGDGESGRAEGVARRRFRGQPQRRQHPPHRVGLDVCPEKADVFSGGESRRGKSQTPCRCSRQRPLFLLVKVQPRQLASQPGSILDRRGGHESAESSSGNALGCRGAVPNGQEGKRAGGPQHYGMPAVSKLAPPEAVGGKKRRAELLRGAKADAIGEELVRGTRWTAGIGGAALQDRRAESKSGRSR